MRRLIVVVAIALAGCTSSAGTRPVAPTPSPTPEPTPTPTPWRLGSVAASYTKQVRVGGTITVTVKIKNNGSATNPSTEINFSELDKYADLFECTPECSVEDAPGLGPSAILPGVPAGKTSTFKIEFVASTAGAVRWSLCVYDNESFGEQVYCGDAATAIR